MKRLFALLAAMVAFVAGSVSATSHAAGGLIQISPASSCPVTGNMEGVFTSQSQMAIYLQCVIPGVDAWIDTVFSAMPHPAAYYLIPSGVSGGQGSGCEYDDNSLQYCLLDSKVYMGSAAVWSQYTKYGDAAPPLIVAHEITHHFQKVAKMTRAKTSNQQIRYEDQADCGAGAFMAYARNNGILSTDDLVDLGSSLTDAGETDGPDRSHGTIQERIRSFNIGYMSQQTLPMFSCNMFVQEVPLITGG